MKIKKDTHKLSNEFRVGYPLALIAKLVLIAFCVFSIMVTVGDLLTLIGLFILVFFIFLGIALRGLKTLEWIEEKEGTNNAERWLIITIISMAFPVPLIAYFIPETTIFKPISLALIAGFATGVTVAEAIFVRRR